MSPEWEGKAEIKGIGIDILPIDRITRLVKLYDRQTLTLLFAPNELNDCQLAKDSARSYAVCFAAKEAVGKALGTGLADVNWTDIEVKITDRESTIHLQKQAMLQAEKREIENWILTWLSWDNHVLVHVFAL